MHACRPLVADNATRVGRQEVAEDGDDLLVFWQKSPGPVPPRLNSGRRTYVSDFQLGSGSLGLDDLERRGWREVKVAQHKVSHAVAQALRVDRLQGRSEGAVGRAAPKVHAHGLHRTEGSAS